MGIFRVEKVKDYTTISNYHLRDKGLSLKAKGLLTLILALPEDWNFTIRGLSAICKEGAESIGTALKELEKGGYLVRKRVRGADGRMSDTEYNFYEEPVQQMEEQSEEYKTSRVAGVACRDAIEKAVAKHYRDNCLNKAGAREVIDEFGKERVMTVLAITIRDKLYDGRFSSANKAWAQAFPIEPDIDSWGGNRNLTLVVRQTHPGLLNLFCDQAKAYESEKVSVREKLKAAAKNAPVPSTKNEMER